MRVKNWPIGLPFGSNQPIKGAVYKSIVIALTDRTNIVSHEMFGWQKRQYKLFVGNGALFTTVVAKYISV